MYVFSARKVNVSFVCFFPDSVITTNKRENGKIIRLHLVKASYFDQVLCAYNLNVRTYVCMYVLCFMCSICMHKITV